MEDHKSKVDVGKFHVEWATTIGQSGAARGVADDNTGRVSCHGRIPMDVDGENRRREHANHRKNVRRGSATTGSGKSQRKVQNRTRVNQSRNGAKARSGRDTMGLEVGRHVGGRCECWATIVVVEGLTEWEETRLTNGRVERRRISSGTDGSGELTRRWDGDVVIGGWEADAPPEWVMGTTR